jgi:fucose permease
VTQRSEDRRAIGGIARPGDVERIDPPAYRRAVWLSWLALFGIGQYTALFGPVLPEMADRTGSSLAAVGALVTALAGAAAVSTLVTGRAVDRYGARPPLVIALLINGVALLMIPWAGSLPVLLTLGVLLGLGDGGIAVATHVLVGQAKRGHEAAALNRLNVFFGVGAIVAPAGAAILAALDLRAALLLVPIGVVQCLAALMFVRSAAPSPPKGDAPEDAAARRTPLTRSGRLWLLAALLLVYVGLELGLGAWTFSYARESAGLNATAAALLTGGFWGALTLSRLVAPIALRQIAPPALLVAGAGVAAAGMSALLLGGSIPGVLVAGILVSGFGFGPIWPVTFALAARAFPRSIGAATGILTMASAVGAAALPWLLGAVLDAAGPTALISLTCAAALLLLLLAWSAARPSSEATASSI